MSFTDVTGESGLDLVIEQQPPRTGTGIGVIYWDDDAFPDLLVSGGTNNEVSVYRNNGNMNFTRMSKDVTGLWFVEGDPRGLAIADFDNDGDSDFFLASWSEGKQSYLFVNEDGYFIKKNTKIGISMDGIATGGSWGDYDNDGDLDLYVGRYFMKQNKFFRNDGDGTFSDVTFEAGFDQSLLTSEPLTFQSMWIDMNRDGLVDLYEMNDRCYNGFSHNRVWINYGGVFYDESEKFGLDLCFDAMGIGFNDYNHDGFLDFFHTNVPTGGHFLLQGGCDGYTQQTAAAGITIKQWGWGVLFDDLNHDRFPDLYIAHAGYVNFDDTNRLYQGKPGGGFVEVAEESDAHLGTNNSAVVVRADFDLDGDQDLIVGGIEGDAHSVLRNDSETGHFLVVELVGTQSNRDGIGAIVDIYAGPVWERRPRVSSDVFGGNNDPGLLFGLGDIQTVERVVVYWPSGVSEVFEDIVPDGRVVLTEGMGEPWLLPTWHERCGDFIDNDCDGVIDEDFPVGTPCQSGLGECASEGVWVCSLDRLEMSCQAELKLPTEEIPGDGKDNDCDGEVDELLEKPSCSGTKERCGDGVDNDCDGLTDEGFEELGLSCARELYSCIAFGEWICPKTGGEQLVCDAALPQPEIERCGDEIDNDCDGAIDEGFGVGFPCEVGMGACVRMGERVCAENGKGSVCNVSPGQPGPELCGDGVDNDCDGATDEGFPVGTACTTQDCAIPGLWGCSEDALSMVCILSEALPPERCGDGIDNDCDGEVDEGFGSGEDCWLGVGVCRRKGQRVCSSDGLTAMCDATIGSPGSEIKDDGLDNDCDGVTDEWVEEASPEMSSDPLRVSSHSDDGESLREGDRGESGCAALGQQPSWAPLFILVMLFLLHVSRIRLASLAPHGEDESRRKG